MELPSEMQDEHLSEAVEELFERYDKQIFEIFNKLIDNAVD